MAPAALLCPSGTVQSLCQTTASSSKVWQAKRSVSSGSALNRPSADSQIEGASVKSSLPKRVYESRRRIGIRHVVRSDPSRYVFSAAVEGSVAVEEPSTESEVVGSSEEKAPEAVPEQGSAPAASPQRKGGKFRRGNSKPKREDPTVPAEALVPGAVFTGKVTTIQPFGAFVNFGAFTDGLVHISKLSSGYVSNVGDIVSLGQEVQVTVIDVDNTAGRIALSMAEKEEKRTEGSGRQGGEAGGDQSRFQEGSGGRPVNKGKSAGRGNQSNRRDEPKKPLSKLVKGQSVEGVVKNSSRGGVYVTLPEDEEAFLKYSEIPGGENMAPEAGLQPGQKITATVLRIDRGKITLSMKPVVDIKSVNSSINKGAGGAATNPFEIAFRAMDLIPEPVAVAEPPVEEVPIVEEPTPEIAAAAAEIVEETKPEEEVVAEVPAEAAAPETVEEKVEEVVETPTVEAAIPAPVENEVTEAPAVEAAIPAPVEEKLEEEAEIPSVEAAAPAPVEEKVEEVTETPAVEAAAPAPFEEKVEEVTEAPDVEAAVPAPVEEKVEEVAETPAVEAAAPAPVEEKAEEVTETPAVEASAPAPVEEKVEEVTETPAVDAAAPTPVEEKSEEVQAPVAAAPVEEKKGGISAALVKQLREETGAGMMDCKKALAESKGDFEKARDALRKKGLASADKKASRIAAEGLIGSYIHDSRIGVLVEVNCETDFVARGPAFKQLVSDLGMQVVASPQVKYVSVEDIPAEIVSKETEMEMQREDLANKPEAVRSKIVEGRVAKRMNEYVLLEQPYIRDDSILVKDLVKQTVATLGENIKVRRFERYTLGEGLEKKNADFAAEVAAQTAKTAEAAKVEEAPAQAKPAEEAAPAPAVAVSAAAVKQLRDSTGAGMMDCKKALAATNGDLEKAVEYLRKKGLASADKKASRLASEGLVGSYVHNGVIGVLVEVNCETDFVARSEQFKELVKDIAMQIAACPSVNAVGVEDIPASFVEAERAIELGKEDLANKPEAVRAKIVDGRLNKRLSEMALLEQPFIKDDTKLIKDVVKETVAALGENIQVRRFTRFNLGEGIEKKVVDFAAEVAAQTGQKL